MDHPSLPIYEVRELSVQEALHALMPEKEASDAEAAEEAERASALGWARPWVQTLDEQRGAA